MVATAESTFILDSAEMSPQDLSAARDAAGASPVDSAFVSGTLMLPHYPSNTHTEYIKTRDTFTSVLIIFSIFTLLASVRRFINIIPSVISCFGRWKEALNLEYSIKLSRDRNLIFTLLIIPACLLLDKFSLHLPNFVQILPPAPHLLAVIGCVIAYILFRTLLYTLCKGKKTNPTYYFAAHKLFRTFFILAVTIGLVTSGILSFTNLQPDTVKHVLFYETAFFYFFFLLRVGQILGHSCSGLITILYLCALEILPLGIFIAATTVI